MELRGEGGDKADGKTEKAFSGAVCEGNDSGGDVEYVAYHFSQGYYSSHVGPVRAGGHKGRRIHTRRSGRAPVAGDEAAPAASVRGETHSLCSSVPEMSDEDCPRCGPPVEGLFETGSDTGVQGARGGQGASTLERI
ncbi:unnamed protein product [Arctogadus glacialis]